MSITKKAAPNLVGQPSVDFRGDDYNATIWNKGYDVIMEKAVECPCRTRQREALSTCKNCYGTGWFFINPFQTKAIITSINKVTQYKNWSIELIGTVAVTVMDSDRVSYMDRVTLKNNPNIRNTSIFSEIKAVRDLSGTPFVFLSYKPERIKEIYLFSNSSAALIRLIEGTDYNISTTNDHIIEFTYDFTQINNYNGSVSILYEHEIQYNVLDLPHDIRSSYITNNDGKKEQLLLPINAVARKVHNVMGVLERDGTGLINNSYI